MFVSNHPIPPAIVIDTARIASAPLFADLPAAELEALAGAMGEAEVDAGTEVVTVDESGSTVYLIEAGEAEVIGAGGPLSVALGPGDTFGEIGLLLTAETNRHGRRPTPMKLPRSPSRTSNASGNRSRSSSARFAASASSAPRGSPPSRRVSARRGAAPVPQFSGERTLAHASGRCCPPCSPHIRSAGSPRGLRHAVGSSRRCGVW